MFKNALKMNVINGTNFIYTFLNNVNKIENFFFIFIFTFIAFVLSMFGKYLEENENELNKCKEKIRQILINEIAKSKKSFMVHVENIMFLFEGNFHLPKTIVKDILREEIFKLQFEGHDFEILNNNLYKVTLNTHINN